MGCVLWSLSMQAQQLILEYDYIEKSSKYLKVNKKNDTIEVNKPIVRNGQDIIIKVINFNENALYTEAEVTSENIIESSNPFGLMNVLSPIFNVSTRGVLTNMFGERGVDVSELTFGYTKDNTRDEQLTNAEDLFVDLNEITFDLANIEQSIEDLEYGLNQLYLLSRNTQLYPQDMKDQARLIVSKALQNGDNPELTSFYRKRDELLKGSREKVMEAELLAQSIKKYERLDNTDNFGFSSKESLANYNKLVLESEEILSAIKQYESSYTSSEVEVMLQLMQQLYFSIRNSNFTYTTSSLAEGDKANINLTFYEIPPVGQINTPDESEEDYEYDDEYNEEENWESYKLSANKMRYNTQPLRTKSFKVNVSGGMKISPSVGVAFPSYLDAAKEYFAVGDTLVSEADASNFIPNIAAFVNFYPYTGRAVNIGGSFGIGIPLSGGIVAPSFMLGPSLVLGNKYRIMVSGGAAFGPVERLDNGFEIDQILNPFQELKTKTKYAVGFYTSISFTVGL